ncbi:hypothetical protein MRX96_018106 [Rhipicephalus microplus]
MQAQDGRQHVPLVAANLFLLVRVNGPPMKDSLRGSTLKCIQCLKPQHHVDFGNLGLNLERMMPGQTAVANVEDRAPAAWMQRVVRGSAGASVASKQRSQYGITGDALVNVL